MSQHGNKKSAFEKALNSAPPSHFTEIRAWLGALYDTLKFHLDNNYSYIEFAVDIGFSQTNVVFLMIRGKRPITLKSAERMASNIPLSAKETRYLLLLAEYENTRLAHEREHSFATLVELRRTFQASPISKAQLQFFTAWYHSVVRELVALPNFEEDPQWIAKQTKPPIRPKQAAESLKLLEELKLIQKNPDTGKLEQTKEHIGTGDDVESLSVVRYHQQMIELGKQSITTITEDERDVSALQIAADDALFEKIKHEVRAFRKHLLALAANHKQAKEAAQHEHIVQLNMQLFPVSEKRRK
jgi:uncharacterized protein (TIGR02147 family)